jgi:Transposase DDE domain group 1
MVHPAGETNDGVLRLDFNRRLMLQFCGSVVTSDAGLLPYRELDDVLGSVIAGNSLADARTGKNGRHALVGLLRQSVFSRLAGYEDVNDAGSLRHDPAMRWIVGGKAAQGPAASPSQMGHFEAQWLTADKNLLALADLSGQWIDRVHARRPPRGIVPDRDSSVSPTHGEQEMSVWNGHYECTCYQRMGRCAQARRGAISGQHLTHLFSGGRGLRESGSLRVSRSRGDKVCDPASRQQRLAGEDRLSADAPGWTTSERGAVLLREFHLSGRKLEETTPGDCQGRMASGRTLSACRLYSHQHEPPGRARRCFLHQARNMRAMDQGRQGRDQMDAAVMSDVRPTLFDFNFTP